MLITNSKSSIPQAYALPTATAVMQRRVCKKHHCSFVSSMIISAMNKRLKMV
jgi:hypothetical protein